MHVLTFGATGYVGTAVARAALSIGWRITCVTRAPPSAAWLELLQPSQACSVLVIPSLADHPRRIETVLAQATPDAVLNAVSHKCAERQASLADYVLADLLYLASIGDALRNYSKPLNLTHLGSALVYGGGKALQREGRDEAPACRYGLAKCIGSRMLKFLNCTCDSRFIELRLFNVYGPGDTTRRLVPYCMRQAKSNLPIQVLRPHAVRDYVYIEDVVTVILSALSGSVLPGTYNVATGVGTTAKQIAHEVVRVARSKSRVLCNPDPTPTDLDAVVGDTARLKAAGLTCPTPLKMGLQRSTGIPRSATSSNVKASKL